jgi:hypothetical protein
MYRIDNADATSTLPTPLPAGPVSHGYFQSGNPATGQKATTVDRDWANATQEEIAAVIEAAGITLSKTNNAQLLAALRQMFATRTLVTSDVTIYVNPTTGNDANNGLTAGTAFATIQAAVNAVYLSYDWHGHACTIQLADGTYNFSVANGYAASIVGFPFGMPYGSLYIRGNVGNPANVVISATNANCLFIQNGFVDIAGVTFTATGTNVGLITWSGYGVNVGLAGYIVISNCRFGNCGNVQLNASGGGIVAITGTGVSFTGASKCAFAINIGGQIWLPGTTITVTGLACSSAVFLAVDCSTINVATVTFVGSATGQRYQVGNNAVIDTGGGGANYLPGNAAGVAFSGGQYV